MNECFGILTFFCADSDHCEKCEDFLACATACRGELQRLSGRCDLSKQIARHEKIMAGLGLIEDKTPRRKPKTESFLEGDAEALYKELTDLNLIKEGWISDDLSLAPEYFRLVAEDIKRYGEITSSNVVKHLGYKIENEPFASLVARCAQSVQVLVFCKIISFRNYGKGQKFKWLLS